MYFALIAFAGEWLQCTNLRMRHPVLKNDSGEPVILKQCAYHVPTCIGDHEYEEPPPINSPNLVRLCFSQSLLYISKSAHLMISSLFFSVWIL